MFVDFCKFIGTVRQCLKNIFEVLASKFEVQPAWDPTYILNVAIEHQDDSSPAGTSWLQVSHLRDNVDYGNHTSTMYIERYFDKEYAQNAYGNYIRVRFDWTNPQEAIQTILKAVNQLEQMI